MEVKFLDAKLDRLETDPKFDGGFAQAIVRSYRKTMAFIRAAPDERALWQMRSLRFEKLKGDRVGDCSLRLNDQWRLILRLEADEKATHAKVVCVVKIEDYH